MQRKTVKIEFIVEDDQNQTQLRYKVRDALSNKRGKLYQALLELGWSGNHLSVNETISNPKRTATWPA